jgi:ATP-dependent DNA helicase RecQ
VGHFDEEIAACGGPCDVCSGTGVEDLVRRTAVNRKTARRAPAGLADDPLGSTSEERAIFERLRSLRKELADSRGIPAYVVFHDTTLREMAARRPSDRSQMLDVTGVGPVKFERYGDAFLQALHAASREA